MYSVMIDVWLHQVTIYGKNVSVNLFMTVTGEEKGLLGSQYYADSDPIFPLDKTVANLNIDIT